MNNSPMVGRTIFDVTTVQVVMRFKDGNGFIQPLTGFAGALVLNMLGFYINPETGELSHYTDRELMDIQKELGGGT